MSQRRLAALEVRSASEVYKSGGSPVTALAEGSLTLSPGAVSGIVGPSGSGKTTLLMIAGLLEAPTTGEVLFDGKVISRPRAKLNELRTFRRTQLGFVFQKANLIPFLTAAENVAIAMQVNDVGRQQAQLRAARLLDDEGLQASGGQSQCRNLRCDPRYALDDLLRFDARTPRRPSTELDTRRRKSLKSRHAGIW